MLTNIDLISKLQQAKLYFANLMDEYVDSFVFSIDRDEKLADKVNCIYELIEALEFQIRKGYLSTDEVTIELYEKIDCLTPIYNTELIIDTTLIQPFISNTTSLLSAWGGIGGDINNQTDLINLLNLKQNLITLTTTGTSGAATFNQATGALNIPEYQGGVTSFNTRTGSITLTSEDVTTALGFTPENVANKSTNVNLGTSDDLYPSQKAVKSYVDAQVTGLVPYTGATESVNLGVHNITPAMVYISGVGTGGGGVLNLKKDTTRTIGGADAANTISVWGDGTSLGFSDWVAGNIRNARFSVESITNNATRTYILPNANGTLALTSDLHAPVTIGTANGLSLSGQQLSLGLASGSANGALSSTDWNTFNSKQNALSGTGIVISNSGVISYITDNSTNWNTAYNNMIVSAAVTGLSTKTLTLTQQDGGTITASWSDIDTGLTSVGISMPSAFTVSNSPLTSNGVIAITAAGNATQYIRGDGALATLPTNIGGGGASLSYYLNGSINQGTIGGVTYYELSKTPIFGAGTDFSTNTNGYIASFLTDAGDPNLLKIPAGNWNFETYFQASSGGGTPTFYVELYKYDGTTFSLIASNSSSPKPINDGTNVEAYFSALAVPETTLTLTDRLAIRIYVVTSGRTITLHTENNTLCQVITTFSTGLTALNGLTTQVQYFSTGVVGTDFNIVSLNDIHTFNLPTASAVNRGALSSADWTTFNNKQNALTNPITGTGAAGQVAFWNGTNTQTGDSGLVWDNTNKRLGVGTATPLEAIHLVRQIGSQAIIRLQTLDNTVNNGYSGFNAFDNLGALAFSFAYGNPSSAIPNIGIIGPRNATGRLQLVAGVNATPYVTMFPTGNLVLQNGGTFTDAGFRLDVNGTARITSTLQTDADAVVNGVNIGRGGGAIGSNTRVGLNALNGNTTGSSNTAIGWRALQSNTTGASNTSLGTNSLGPNTTGFQNTAFGVESLGRNTTGNNNTAIGNLSLLNNISGGSNIAVGNSAGRHIADGTTANTITNNSIYIGENTRALADNQTNQIVIGHSAIGLGSNTTVLGNSSTSFGRWWGNLLLGTSTNTGQQLQVVGTTLLNGLTTIQGTTASDTAPLGAELLTTGTGDASWTGTDFATGYTHVVGSTTTLTSTLAGVVNTLYQITYTVTGRTAGSFTVGFGGFTSGNLTATGATGPMATTTGSLVITPTTDFNGTIVLSIRTIGTSSASVTFNNSSGTTTNQIRISSLNNNTFIGLNAGNRNTTGFSNTANGFNALANNTTGFSNTAVGSTALFNNNIGSENTAFGTNALQSNRIGNSNTAIGAAALFNNIASSNVSIGSNSTFANAIGSNNTVIGNSGMQNNVSGSFNSVIGFAALFGLTGGGSNTAVGNNAGRFAGSGTTAMTSVNNSIYLGFQTRGLNATGSTNEIVIGFDVVGLGSNTTVLGNSSTLSTAIYGDLLLGQTTDNGTDILQVTGSSRLNGVLNVTGSTTAASAIARGANFTPTLVAAANNDVLVGLDIAPTFTNGSFNGVSNFALRVQGPTQINSSLTIGNLLSVLYNLQNQEVALFQRAGSYGPVIRLGRTGITNATTIDYPTDGAFGISTSGTEKFRIFNNGNVVIQNGGTFTDAGFRLDVNGTARITSTLNTDADAVVNGVNIGRGAGNIASNTRVGANALTANTTGFLNTAVGNNALNANTTGNANTAVGNNALILNNTGSNTAIGRNSLRFCTSGINTAIGSTSLENLSTGDNNVALGWEAGFYISGGSTFLTIANNSIFLGNTTRALANNQTNQIVIGHAAIGLGSNTTVLGNSSTLSTAIYGDLLLGQTTDNGTDRLQITGSARVSSSITAGSFIRSGGTASEFLKADGSVDSNTYALSSALANLVTTNTTQTITGIKVFNDFRLQLAAAGTSQPTVFQNASSVSVGSGGYNTLGFNSNSDLFFNDGTNNSVVLSFSNTTTRTYNLPDASGTLAFTSQIPSVSGTTNFLPKFTGASTLGNSLIFDNGTNVGIGTTSPNSKLSLFGSQSGFAPLFTIKNTLTNNNGGVSYIRISADNTDEGFNIGIHSVSHIEPNLAVISQSKNAALSFDTNATERMRITSSGNVGIGTTSPAQKLDVNGLINSTNGISVGGEGVSRFWTGTQAQYDAIGTKVSTTVYLIT